VDENFTVVLNARLNPFLHRLALTLRWLAIPAQAYPRTSRRRGVGVTDDQRRATEGVQQNVQHHVQQENELANLSN
jgi:hypothetical protein